MGAEYRHIAQIGEHFWALVARYSGNGCPRLVQSMPEACSVDARGLFIDSPSHVHWMLVVCSKNEQLLD